MSQRAADGRSVIARTTSGLVRGLEDAGVRRFLGIPYAAPPVGTDRFSAPRPHPPWEGAFDADRHGPTPPQAPYPGVLGKLLPSVRIPGEEFLNLCIWAPVDRTGLPVMVWVPGGALTRGSNAIGMYDGRAFARDGVVLVSINYRLGAEGFSVLDDTPMNLGLADQVAALRWVQDNIAAFGGDPQRVTVFGQSAGAGCIAALLAHPDRASLFSQAILQSGPLEASPPERAAEITRRMGEQLGIAPTRVAFSRIPPEVLVDCHAAISGGTQFGGGPAYALAIDGDLVPANPLTALLAGAGQDVPLMVGSTTDEHRLWLRPTGATLTRIHLLAARLKLKIPGRAVRRYRRNRPGAPHGEILGALVTDLLLRVPANRLADARLSRGGQTWMYEFSWPSPVADLGAAHAVDVPFVFDTLHAPEAAALVGPKPPQALAERMHRAWVRFATDGDPGWPAWDNRRPVMTFGDPASDVVLAPRDDERRALARDR